MIKKTLGGDRLGSGNRMKVELHNYERSTHDKGYLWRSTMSAGTLVPFLCKVANRGDSFDIDLEAMAKTLPTVGPLFGSAKVQLDVFLCPWRLYQGQLHNNSLNVGRNMSSIKLPLLQIKVPTIDTSEILTNDIDIDNAQINPSCILAYLGIRGVGIHSEITPIERNFNAILLIS